ncbi:MAG: hypothetical protein ACFFDI_25800 [Promethearchaeota archaeon]
MKERDLIKAAEDLNDLFFEEGDKNAIDTEADIDEVKLSIATVCELLGEEKDVDDSELIKDTTIDAIQFLVDEEPDLFSEKAMKKVVNILGLEIEKPEKKKEEPKAKTRTKAKESEEDDEEPKSTRVKAKAKEKSTGKKNEVAPKKLNKKGTGVIATIVEEIKNSGKEGISKEEILKVLAKKFPDRTKDSMRNTINVQVPARISKERFKVKKLENGNYRKA